VRCPLFGLTPPLTGPMPAYHVGVTDKAHVDETPHQSPSAPLRVLFVCTANVCRSAFAEVMTGQRTDPGALEVGSAGINGWRRHPVERYMADQLIRRGLDPSPFRSRRLQPEMIDSADVVLTMEASQCRLILELRPGAVGRTFSLGQFARGAAGLQEDRASEPPLTAVGLRQPEARDEDDVVDPYGRGPAAAQQAADRIERLLASVVPVLLELQRTAPSLP
jgi:protein-tyrosine-phosphatase